MKVPRSKSNRVDSGYLWVLELEHALCNPCLFIQDGGLDRLFGSDSTSGTQDSVLYCPDGVIRSKWASPYRKWQNFFATTIVRDSRAYKAIYLIIIVERECWADFFPFVVLFSGIERQFWKQYDRLLNTFLHCISILLQWEMRTRLILNTWKRFCLFVFRLISMFKSSIMLLSCSFQ